MIRTKEVLRSAPREGQQRHAPDGAGSASELDYRDGTALQKSCWLTDDVTAGHACSLPCPPPPCRPYVCWTYAQTPRVGSHTQRLTLTADTPPTPAAFLKLHLRAIAPPQVGQTACCQTVFVGPAGSRRRDRGRDVVFPTPGCRQPAAGSSRKSDHPVDCGSLSKMRVNAKDPCFRFVLPAVSKIRSLDHHRTTVGALALRALKRSLRLGLAC